MFSHGLDVLDPESVVENIHMSNYLSAAENAPALRAYLDDEVRAGHYLRTRVGEGPTPARVVPVAFIPKPGQPGKFRLISDASLPKGRSTNSSSPNPPHFKMTTIADVFARANADTFATITDVAAAFRGLPLNPLHAGLLAVEFEGFYYWELRAPFGWTLAPFSWCRVSSLIQRYCAFHGHNVVVYVDDFLGLAQSEEAANSSQEFLINLLHSLGLQDKPSKQIKATRTVPFIGFIIDFPSLSVSVSPERASEILHSIQTVASSKFVRLSTLQTLAGKLTFVAQVVLGGRVFVRRIYDMCTSKKSKIPVSPPLLADLRWWSKYLLTFNGKKVVHWTTVRHQVSLCTDASNVAACGVGPGPTAWIHAWTPKQDWHINIRELWAIHRSLVVWGHKWDNHDVAVATDNTAVASWINKGSARSPQAMAIIRKIFWLLISHNIRLRAVWIPTELNFAADAGSRLLTSELHSFTNIQPSTVLYSGSRPVLATIKPFSLLPSAVADHSQTLLRLKTPWPSWRSRVYNPRWPNPPYSLTEVAGSPSFGFAWPMSGTPTHLPKSSSFDLPLGCGSAATLTPLSRPTSAPSLHSTLPLALKSPLPRPNSQLWEDVCAEFDECAKGLKVRPTLPSSCWSSSVPTSTSTHPNTLPCGPLSVWASSPSFVPETWFRNLKTLGNPAPTSHVAMSVLLNGVQSYSSASPKLASSMALRSKSPFRTSLVQSSAQSLPSSVSSPVSSATLTHRCSHMDTIPGSLTPTSPTSSALWHPGVGSTHQTMDVTAPGVVEPRLLRPPAASITTSSFKDCGNLMPSSATSGCLSTNGGTFLTSWPPLPARP